MTNIVHFGDCMHGMADKPDKWYDLAVVDPEYGIGFSDYERGSSGIKVKERYTKQGKKKWDKKPPEEEYFNELFRVSKNQIIWGANYFKMQPTKHFIFWYKRNPVPNFADGEYAWTSFDRPAVCFDYIYYGNINAETTRIHPTQKPVVLYDWIFKNYAKPGMKILDTHVGSGSSRISAHKAGLDFEGWELDPDYHAAQEARYRAWVMNTAPAELEPVTKDGQIKLF